MGADSRCGGFFVVGVVDAEAGEDVQGMLPVCAGQFELVQGVVGVGEAVVSAGLIAGLVQFGGEREGVMVVGEGGLGVAVGVL